MKQQSKKDGAFNPETHTAAGRLIEEVLAEIEAKEQNGDIIEISLEEFLEQVKMLKNKNND